MGAYTLVSVRAFERQGFDGFFRGGVKWPDTGRLAFVSGPLLAVLRSEKRLAVDTDPELPEEFDESDVDRFDLPPATDIDEGARAADEAKRIDRQIEEENARLNVAKKRAELEKLRQKRIQAEKAAGQAEAEKAEAKAGDK